MDFPWQQIVDEATDIDYYHWSISEIKKYLQDYVDYHNEVLKILAPTPSTNTNLTPAVDASSSGGGSSSTDSSNSGGGDAALGSGMID